MSIIELMMDILSKKESRIVHHCLLVFFKSKKLQMGLIEYYLHPSLNIEISVVRRKIAP
ncbi:hypothetical protein [Neobacillus sp. D3-1R]|uniref:hypothetical protein n=1 Tax=Neobacillus sp. D3-1R TaxID=3445778 RepID=UPI003F9EFC08